MPAKQHLARVAIKQLRPTQITVGAIEVAAKRAQWAALKPKERAQLLDTHWFPTVLGPEGEVFIVDHHHLGLALTQEDVSHAWALQLADFSSMPTHLFWRLMSFKHWAHPYDEHGALCEYAAIPGRLGALRDDPYRSLAGEVRTAGGFAKDSEPYVEFLWADFFRDQFTRKALQPDKAGALPAKVLAKAVQIAKSTSAQNLPGWSGTGAPTPTKSAKTAKNDKR